MKKKTPIFFCHSDFTPLLSKKFKSETNFFPLLFPKDSKSLKSFDIGLREVGANKLLNGLNKVLNIQNQSKKEMSKSFVKIKVPL